MKSLVALIILFTLSFADGPDSIKAKIIGKVATSLLEVSVVFIYTDDPAYEKLFEEEENLIETKSCSDADMILSNRLEKYRTSCPPNSQRLYFATSYSDYIKNRDAAVGAFFWQKGRPNLILNAKKLKELKIKLPSEFDNYIE